MYKFIFRLQDGSKYELKNVESIFVSTIWEKLDEFCMMFESESNKVKSVMQVEM